MGARREHRGRRRRVAALSAATALLAAASAIAAASKPVVLSDPGDDVSGVLDIQRVSLSLPSDGRLRAVITLTGKIDPKQMLAASGPPGSVCLKLWTAADADPAAARADRLVCITAHDDDELRATVFEQREPGLPRRLGPASVAVNDSRRSFILRVSQSSLARPELVRFAVESTRPGCVRVSCIDQSPDDGAVRRFRLRGQP
ncbi:MAG: hypothetical protein QOJ89_1962 [bacterium]